MRQHRLRKSRNLIGSFAVVMPRCQQGCNLVVADLASEYGIH
jgi:hypothetical protein